MKKKLNITFVNPNTEEQIVQAMCGVIAYNLSEANQKLNFDYSYIKKYQDSQDTNKVRKLKNMYIFMNYVNFL